MGGEEGEEEERGRWMNKQADEQVEGEANGKSHDHQST